MTERPKDRVETRAVTWRAVVGPLLCECGHEHWGWSDGTLLAPQWGYCGACECKGLRRPAVPEGKPEQ